MNRTSSIALVVLLAALGLGMTYFVQLGSAPRIAAEQRLIDSGHLLDLIAPDSYDNQPLEHPITIEATPLTNSTLLGGYLATRGDQPVAVLLRSQTLGYAGAIDLLIAVDANGRLLGVKTLKQLETPGLGQRSPTGPMPGSGFFPASLEQNPVTAAGR